MNRGEATAAVDPARRRRPAEFLSCWCRLQNQRFLIFHLLVQVATTIDWGEEKRMEAGKEVLEGHGECCVEL